MATTQPPRMHDHCPPWRTPGIGWLCIPLLILGLVLIGQGAVGPHRLRHALAIEMLGRGAALPAISQVLRHRDLATTAAYAKVDLAALSTVARPWPEVTR